MFDWGDESGDCISGNTRRHKAPFECSDWISPGASLEKVTKDISVKITNSIRAQFAAQLCVRDLRGVDGFCDDANK